MFISDCTEENDTSGIDEKKTKRGRNARCDSSESQENCT